MFLNDRVLDLGLDSLAAEADRLDICSAEPATYTQATATYSLGNQTALSVAAPADRAPSGRKVTVAEIAATGLVTATGIPTYWAITDTVNGRLLAVGAISQDSPPTEVVSGNAFSLAAFDIGIPDPGGS